MAGAAPAYRYNTASHAPAVRPQRGPQVRVVPGRRSQTQTLDPALIKLARMAMAAIVVVALLGCARIALSAASVQSQLQSSQLTSQIQAAQATGNSLEVKVSTLSSSSRIKQVASADLGMSAPTSTEALAMSEDIVQTDASGNLSLSGTLAAAAAQG